MSQPTPYSRQFDFTGWSASRPSDPQPGTGLDSEFNALKTTIDAILANLVQIQRDDGAPKNSTVTLDTLATDVLNTLGSGQGWNPRGAWVTATAYEKGDVVAEDGGTYVATVAHTSGTFSTDEAADKWVPIFGAVASGSLVDGAVTGPKIADGAVTAAKLGFTSLDLTGSLRGQTGIAGGTALAAVYPVAGQFDSGDAYSSIARATQAQGKVGFRMDGGTGGKVWTLEQPASFDHLRVTYDGTENFRFTSAGYLGIQTTSPLGPLHVTIGASGAFFSRQANDGGASSSAVSIQTPSTAARIYGYGASLEFWTAAIGGTAAKRFEITFSGLLISAPTYSNTTASAANAYIHTDGEFRRSTSSLRFKEVLEPLADEWAYKLLDLDGIFYKSLCKGDNPDWTYYGFGAETVAEVDPRWVFWKDQAPDGVQYERMVVALQHIAKREKARADEAEARLTAVEVRLAAAGIA